MNDYQTITTNPYSPVARLGAPIVYNLEAAAASMGVHVRVDEMALNERGFLIRFETGATFIVANSADQPTTQWLTIAYGLGRLAAIEDKSPFRLELQLDPRMN